MKFGFYRWKVLWTEKTTLKVTSMEKLFRSSEEVVHRFGPWMSSVCATLDGLLLLSQGRPLNQIWEEKQNHKIKRELNCVYQFFHVFSKKEKLFHPFNNKMISFFPFSLANLFLSAVWEGNIKLKRAQYYPDPKKRITAKSQNFAECEKREMNGEAFNDAWRGLFFVITFVWRRNSFVVSFLTLLKFRW